MVTGKMWHLAAIGFVLVSTLASAQTPSSEPVSVPVSRSLDGLLPAGGMVDKSSGKKLSERTVELRVLTVVDPDFSPPENVDRMLQVAARVARQKLRLTGVRFKTVGQVSVAAFLDKHTQSDKKCLERSEPRRVAPGLRDPMDVSAAAVEKHLRAWPLSELVGFFPEAERGLLTSHAAVVPRLLRAYSEKLRFIAGLKLPNGRSLLEPGRAEWRSYSRWSCAMLNQDEADVVITNTLLLLDDGERPPPAGIFHKLKASGVAFVSPKRQPMWGSAIVASTFAVSSSVPFFRELPPNLDTESEASIIGTFVVAHELGHALFKIPDFYDHPLGCLMTSRPNQTQVEAYRELLANTGSCAECERYLTAHEALFEFVTLAEQGEMSAASKKMLDVLDLAPTRADGDYGYIIKRALLEVGPLYSKHNADKEFRRLAGDVLKRLQTPPASSQPATQPVSPPK